MTRTANILLVATMAVSLTGMAAGPAFADDVEDINAMITSLAPIAGQTDASAPVDTGGDIIYVLPSVSVDLEVFFNLNSDGLTSGTQYDLSILGQALMSDALMPFSYLIAGHTDASGPAAYNQQLSERRAMTVRNFLIEEFGVDPDRLIRIGWGETRLKDPDAPTSAINRRVEITLIVPPDGFVVMDGEVAGPVDEAGDVPAGTADDPPPVEPTPLPGTLQTDDKGNVTIVW
ncbi:MAG: OmpA family protein [Alphaproteobacteria bacterium]|nr:OmpA family protein [Alphaproteobacteria bacterium]